MSDQSVYDQASNSQNPERAVNSNTLRREAALTPSVDVIEDAQGITLYADMPGVSKERLSLKVEADTLTIEGDVSLSAPEGLQPLHVELRQPRYRRVFTLSRELDSERINAEFRHGVLKLHIPKVAQAQARKINVSIH